MADAKPRKYPYVSLYQPASRGGQRWNATYKLGGRVITERLGFELRKAEKRARVISETIDDVKSKIITVEQASRKLGEAKPIEHYVKLFERELRSDPDVGDKHLLNVMGSLRILIADGGVKRAAHLTVPAVERAKLKMAEAGKTGRTIGGRVALAKRFSRFLVRKGALADDPLASMSADGGASAEPERPRRPASRADVGAMVAAAGRVGVSRVGKVPAEVRQLLYLTSFTTGLRYSECRRLRVRHLRLDVEPPTIEIPRGRGGTKNKKAAQIPLVAGLAARLSHHLRGRGGHGPDDPLFGELPAEMSKAVAADMAEAGIEREADNGHLDFHSLRHGFVTELARSGVDVSTLQKLARHSTAVLTLNVYAHVGAEVGERARAVEASLAELPALAELTLDAAETTGPSAANEPTEPEPNKSAEKAQRNAQRLSDDVSRNETTPDNRNAKETTP